MKRRVVSGIVLMLLLTSMLSSAFNIQPVKAEAEPNPTVYVDPSTITVQVGVTFDVRIMVSNVQNLWAWQAGIEWDPNVLEFVSFDWGDLQTLAETVRREPTADKAKGRMYPPATETMLRLDSPVSAASLTLLSISFKAVNSGISSINLINVVLKGQDRTTTTAYAGWGDLNGDLLVNVLDLVFLLYHWFTGIGDPGYYPSADFNGDGFIDVSDLAIASSNYGKEWDGLGDPPETPTLYDIPITLQNGSVTTPPAPVYIRADGSVDPPDTPILNVGNVYYTFTADIYGYIVVQKSNIIIDGGGFTLQGTGSGNGFYIYGICNVTIKNANIRDFDHGIRLNKSSNNTISRNNVTANNHDGIHLYESSNNSISGNGITENIRYGIWLSRSSNNTLRNNVISGNRYNFRVDGLELSHHIHHIDSSNTVDSKPVYYWVNHQNERVPADAGYVALVNCTNITVQNLELKNNGMGLQLAYTKNLLVTSNNITNNHQGIWLVESSDNTVCKNNITNNNYGLYLIYSPNNTFSDCNITANEHGILFYSSPNNEVSENTIANNWCGISPLYESFDNRIFHNNFINTRQVYIPHKPVNVWDDGYPSGGNYWSDYEQIYPDAEELDDSGIWDTPYVIDENNQDNYPLIGPWTPAPPEVPDNFVDLGNLTDEATHNLKGWGAAQGPPENPYISPSGDRTKRYQLLRGDNSVDLMVDEASVPYFLMAEVEDGYCTDNFEIYVNGEGPIYEYIGKNVGTGPVTAVRHEVLVPADYITARMVTITFRNTATDDCGLAAVYNVGLTPTPPTVPTQPVNLSPADGATDVSLTPELCSSPPLQDVDPDSIPWEEIVGVEALRVRCQWQITTAPGDYSDPVYDETLLYLIGRRDFPELPEKVCTWVDEGVLDYGATYYWRVRHRDFRDVWSPWSEETSFTTKIKMDIKRIGLFGVQTIFLKKGSEDYVVSFEILDREDQVVDVKHHVIIRPSSQKISERSFTLSPSMPVRVDIIFDPLEKVDLEKIENVRIRIIYSNGKITVEKSTNIYFEDYKDIIATDFDMTEDAYNFSNNNDVWKEGKCYGMAATSILYYNGKLTRPNNKETTYGLDIEEATPRIDEYQGRWWENKFQDIFISFEDNKMETEEYDELKECIGKGEPVIFFLAGGIEGFHAVVVYKIVENKGKVYLITYDNNWPYGLLSMYYHEAFPKITYDFGSKELSYLTYTRFKWVKAMKEPFLEKILICSTGKLRVYDSQGRVTGLVNGEVRQEIPLSVYGEENETVMIFYPSDTYRYEVVGSDEGTYGLEITSVEGGNTTTFTASDIPTSPNAIHQYTIDWGALSRSEEGTTVMVDSDGDGTFEHSFTSDSELTRDEFMLQTATTVDFDPDTLNLKSEGKWVTVYIELPEGYDPSQIDISSIMLNGTVPALAKPTEIGDYDGDGIPDLMVKFDRASVIELFAEKSVPGNYMIEVTGTWAGIRFKGTVTIRVISPS